MKARSGPTRPLAFALALMAAPLCAAPAPAPPPAPNDALDFPWERALRIAQAFPPDARAGWGEWWDRQAVRKAVAGTCDGHRPESASAEACREAESYALYALLREAFYSILPTHRRYSGAQGTHKLRTPRGWAFRLAQCKVLIEDGGRRLLPANYREVYLCVSRWKSRAERRREWAQFEAYLRCAPPSPARPSDACLVEAGLRTPP